MGLIGGKPKQWSGQRRWVGDMDQRSMIWGWVSIEMEDWAEAWIGGLGLGSAWACDVEAGGGVGRRR